MSAKPMFDEREILSLLWKLQRAEADKGEILAFITESIRAELKKFAEDLKKSASYFPTSSQAHTKKDLEAYILTEIAAHLFCRGIEP